MAHQIEMWIELEGWPAVNGLRWLLGVPDDDGRPTLAEISAFIAGSATA